MIAVYPKIKNSLIKIVGLLEETPQLEKNISENGYVKQIPTEEEAKFLKDYFYADFRNLMFFKHMQVKNRHFVKEYNQTISLSNTKTTEEMVIKDAEIFLFGEEYIALFCVTIESGQKEPGVNEISNLLNLIRQFDVNVDEETKWYNWIENEVLCGTKIRGEGVTVDDYSGSKFKLFTVLDLEEEINIERRMNLLYDIGTTSPLGASSDPKHSLYPHPDYYSRIMENRISVFNNWEALALFDSFTAIGNGILNYKKTWSETYFRIYLLRLFFKFNLYRYNSMVSHDNKIVDLRASYEKFLNIFDIYPISYNFLPNEIFEKIGDGLEIKSELEDFHNRISRISDAIKERKQEKMNLLLEFISVISAVATVEVIPSIIGQSKEISGFPAVLYFSFLAIVFIISVNIIYRFMSPNKKVRSIWKILFGKK